MRQSLIFFAEYVRGVDEPVAVVYPSIVLRDQWVEKLRQRFDESGLEKDRRAWVRAIGHYEEDVQALMKVPFASCRTLLTSMDYDLKEEVENIVIR